MHLNIDGRNLMFNHVMVGADDINASKRFYDATLGTLGLAPGNKDSEVRCSYRGNGGVFMIKVPINGEPASIGNGGTIGFKAKNQEEVDAWHAAGVIHGGTTCEDPPGLRINGKFKIYLAYLRDPIGNKLCASYLLPKEISA
jgi:catechol 2,3-dioxygenase-like lactoylglutathione lyase family enzyme